MGSTLRTALLAGLSMAVVACGPKKPFEGATVEAFVGRVVHEGQPVRFPEGEEVSLTLFHETGQSFGIPLQPDGSFTIGWMPIGKFSVMLNRAAKSEKGAPTRYNVPGGLEIEDGKTQYTIDLGKGFKP